jgi:tetratricopeptide (TPR) repeat protein
MGKLKRKARKSPHKRVLSKNDLKIEELYRSAITYLQMGLVGQAVEALGQILSTRPGHTNSLHLLGKIKDQQGLVADALPLFKKALLHDKTNRSIHADLADLYFYKLNNAAQAIPHYKKAIAGGLRSKELLVNLATAYQATENYLAAIDIHNEAISLDSDFAFPYYNLGLIYRIMGEKDKAVSFFREALRINPGDTECFRVMVSTQKHPVYDELAGNMEKRFSAAETTKKDRINISFALAHILETTGKYDQAFNYLSQANTLSRTGFKYDSSLTKNFFLSIKQTFNDKTLTSLSEENTDYAPAGFNPIFIIGMPRSGTSLVEQIVASHPEIHGMGETSFIEQAVTIPSSDGQLALPDQELLATGSYLKEMAEKYVAGIKPQLPDQTTFFTDKMPQNFLYLGMIRSLFPTARIIHCRRDPVATCFSCYKNFFAWKGQEFAYDLQELAEYYLMYMDLMDHWRTVIPDSFLEVNYADIINGQETETRKMLDFCGLDWHQDCMDFHQTKRAVITASVMQVRQPIYKTSLDLWKNYAKGLDPLLKTLEAGGALN